MKSILLPTDFSEAAHNAFEFALHLADDLGAEIRLLHVYPEKHVMQAYYTAPFIDYLQMDKIEEALARFDDYQKEAQSSIGKSIPVSVVLEMGRAETVIERYSKEVDLIVMGTQGIQSSKDKIFGSVTAHTLQLSQCPVLSIPNPVSYKGINHIMFATALEEEDPQEELFAISEVLDAKLSFVHVEISPPANDEFAFASIEKVLEGKSHPRVLGLYSFTHTDVFAGLNTFVYQNDVDLVAMMTHRRDLFGRLFHKSHTQDMAMYSLTPLLVFQD